MPTQHIVRQGECLVNIARQYGFPSWRALYDAPENAELRNLRPNPNLLYPGDVVVIPGMTSDWITLKTGRRHTFVIRRCTARILLRFDGLDTYKYRFEVGTTKKEGIVGADEPVQVDVDPALDEGDLWIWPDAYETPEDAGERAVHFPVSIGALDPVETTTGVQARLAHLGYYSGEVDGIEGELTRGAVYGFQQDNPPLAADGQCGPETQRVLVERHGC